MADRRDYMRAYQRRWMLERRAEWIAAHGPCAKCGTWERLEVDHVDPAEKSTPVSALWSLSDDNPRRVAELAKCQVLCHACHIAKTKAWRRERAETRHGFRATYNSGCRCDECRRANAEYSKRRRSTCSP